MSSDLSETRPTDNAAAHEADRRCRAVILAGGRGSRLSPLTTVIPKPLVPVGDHPIIELLIKQLVRDGIPQVTISLGYLGHLIRAVLGDGSQFGAEITYTDEREPLGTAGALSLVQLADEDSVLVLNGDTLTDLDFGKVIAEHRQSDAAASVVVMERHVNVDFGVIGMGPHGELATYTEKPTFSYLVSIGVNVLGRSALSNLDRAEYIDMPQLLLRVRDAGFRVRCAPTTAFWLDLGRIDDLRAAGELYAENHERFLH